MSTPTAIVQVSAPIPRGQIGPTDWSTVSAATYPVLSLNITQSWGTEPAQGNLIYPSANSITVGSAIKVTLGQYFYSGICESDTPLVSSHGNNRELIFKDYRKWLEWDKVYCSFNNIDDRWQNNRRVRRYWSILPFDYSTMRKTWSDIPYTTADIMRLVLHGPGIETPWTFGYLDNAGALTQDSFHPNMTMPHYNLDYTSGTSLANMFSDLCGQLGLLFTLMPSATKLFNIVFAQKGVDGPDFAGFPTDSDDRKNGLELSGNPTRIRVVGDRNIYQVHDINLVPDWNRNWDQFYDENLLIEFCFQNFVGWDRVGDPEQIIARQQARSLALEMTVWQLDQRMAAGGFAAVGSFLDPRRYGGRARNNMPAALYIRNLLFRSFRLPTDFWFRNTYGQAVDYLSYEIQDKLLAKVTHDPISGLTQYDPAEAVDGNAYVVVRGYQVGKDMFDSIRPERFNILEWRSSQDIWQKIDVRIEDAGDIYAVAIVFDEPVIRSEDLVTLIDGFAAFNAAPTITVPQVRATLCFAAEKFSWWQTEILDPSTPPSDPVMGTQIHDETLNIGGLNGEFISISGANLYEIFYADGASCRYKAIQNANNFLKFQAVHAKGDFHRPIADDSPAYSLHGKSDRVTVSHSASGSTVYVSLTNERQRVNFVPERDLDRVRQLNTLLPGQAQLKSEARFAAKIAAAVRTSKDAYKLLSEAFHGNFVEYDNAKPTFVTHPAINPVPLGTPFVGGGLTLSFGRLVNTKASAWDATSDPKLPFAGVTVRNNENIGANGATINLQSTGTAIAMVKGPVTRGESVGFKQGEAKLVSNPDQPVGKALQTVDQGDTKRIKVALGSGGGGPATNVTQFKVKKVRGDYLVCRRTAGDMDTDVFVAKPFVLRHSIVSRAIEGETISYTYGVRSFNLDGQRTATDIHGNSEAQIVIPVWNVDDLVYGQKSDGTIADGSYMQTTDPDDEDDSFDTQNVDYVAVEDGRAWCRIWDQ